MASSRLSSCFVLCGVPCMECNARCVRCVLVFALVCVPCVCVAAGTAFKKRSNKAKKKGTRRKRRRAVSSDEVRVAVCCSAVLLMWMLHVRGASFDGTQSPLTTHHACVALLLTGRTDGGCAKEIPQPGQHLLGTCDVVAAATVC